MGMFDFVRSEVPLPDGFTGELQTKSLNFTLSTILIRADGHLKPGMKGVYQHCGEGHLHRYLGEFEFSYNNRIALGCYDADRSTAALKGIVGKASYLHLP